LLHRKALRVKSADFAKSGSLFQSFLSSGFFAAHPVLSKSTFRRTPLSADKAAALLDLATVASFTVAPHNNKNKGDPNDFKSVTAMLQFFLRYEYPPPADNVGTCPKCIGSPG
ncbi:hypothetical protein, partial [Pseudomonas aeruginosa]|uniref:hypothetical protein n=2 Tax=Pseudomonas aeruginosa TaxID=287 RepID=UPI0019D5CCCA